MEWVNVCVAFTQQILKNNNTNYVIVFMGKCIQIPRIDA